MMMTIIEFLIMIPIMYFGWKVLWISTIMLDERKARYRAGTHDYYDNPIEDKE